MKQIKNFLVVVFLCCAAAQQQATAIEIPPAPYFRDLRNELTNQLTIASNAVAVDRRLISKLKSTLKTIDKNTTNTLAPGTKTLALVTKTLNKTSLSNVFNAQLQLIVDIYTDRYVAAQTGLVSQLGLALPGKKRDAAQKALDKLLASIDAASSNLNSNLATKALSAASKNLILAQKRVTTATKAALPPPFFQADIAINGFPSMTFKPSLTTVTRPVPGGGNFSFNAEGMSGSGADAVTLSISFALTDLVQGSNTATISADGANQFTVGGPNVNVTFNSTGGIAHVFWNEAIKNLVGNFSFNVLEQGGSHTGAISGTFSVLYP